MRFLGLGLSSKVPDAKTIWLFRDTLTQSGVFFGLFRLFESQLEAKGLITHKRHKSAAKTARAPILAKKQIEP